MEDSDRSVIVCNLYIADGLTADIDKLLGAFVRSGSLRYETFVELWKDMKFNQLFRGRPSLIELREFAEEALHVAKTYLTNLKNTLVMRVGALYILYGMAYTQPLPQHSRIRVVASECLPIEQLITWSREEEHYDVLYVWGRMLVDGVVQFHLTEREYGAERSLRKYYDVGKRYSDVRSRVNKYECSVLTDLVEGAGVTGRLGTIEAADLDHLPVSWSDMDKLAQEYHQEKCQLKTLMQETRGSRVPPQGLDYADPKLPKLLQESIQRLLQDEVADADQSSSKSDVLLERRTAIKKRGAAAKIVQPQHHKSVIDTPSSSEIKTQSRLLNSKDIPDEVHTCEQIPITEAVQENTEEDSDEDILYVIEVQDDPSKRKDKKSVTSANRYQKRLGIDHADSNDSYDADV